MADVGFNRGQPKYHFLLLLLLAFSLSTCSNAAVITPETRLYNDLFTGYISDARPILNRSSIMEVSLNFIPTSLVDLDEVGQTMKMTGIMSANWTDPRLIWDPALYDRVSTIAASPKRIWLPALGIYNSNAAFFDTTTQDGLRVNIFSSGRVIYYMMGTYMVNCEMDTTYFPFDKQSCKIEVVSLSDSTRTLRMNPSTPELSRDMFSENGQWDIKLSTATRTTIRPIATGGFLSFNKVDFQFHLERRNMYHLLNIIVPLLLTIILVPICFLLPADSGDKLQLGVTVLLTLSVFLLALGESTPETSLHVPIIREILILFSAIFITFQMVITTLCIICTSGILALHYTSSTKRPPATLRRFILGGLAKVLCLGDQSKEVKEEEQASWATRSSRVSLEGMKEEATKDDSYLKMNAAERKLLDYMEVMVQKIKDDQAAGEMLDEWKRMAWVLDWLFFWFFLISIIAAIIFLFSAGVRG